MPVIPLALRSGFLGNAVGEIKNRAFVWFGFGPDAAAMLLHNTLDGGHAHARAFEIPVSRPCPGIPTTLHEMLCSNRDFMKFFRALAVTAQ